MVFIRFLSHSLPLKVVPKRKRHGAPVHLAPLPLGVSACRKRVTLPKSIGKNWEVSIFSDSRGLELLKWGLSPKKYNSTLLREEIQRNQPFLSIE